MPCFTNEDDFFDFKIRIGYDFYDKVGRDKFRLYTSLDASAIKEYKESLNAKY